MWGPLGDEGWSGNLASKTLQTRMGKAKKEMKKKIRSKSIPTTQIRKFQKNSIKIQKIIKHHSRFFSNQNGTGKAKKEKKKKKNRSESVTTQPGLENS